MSSVQNQPWRTCAGCRQRAAKHELVRLVVVAGRVTVDFHQTMPGRGAYLHPACASQAVSRRAFNRAFRAQVDTSDLLAQLSETNSQPSETGV